MEMLFEVEVIRNGKTVENYMATEYKAIAPRGRCGNTIPKEERKITEVKVLPEGKTRNKKYSSIFGDTVIIREAYSGRRCFTLEAK